MERMILVQSLRQKFLAVQSVLHERGRRIWAASEAKQIGWGGATIVEEATGITRKTIRRGLQELEQPPETPLDQERCRKTGGGRKKIDTIYPDIRQRLDALIDPMMRGDPESPLRWTCKSTWKLAEELSKQKITVTHNTVRQLLHAMDYSLQANRKTREGTDHPDRNDQFLYINKQVQKFLNADQPVISVDTKKKENLGNFSNKGVEYRPKGKPLETNMHDFPDETLGKAIPYGVYDIGRNEGFLECWCEP